MKWFKHMVDSGNDPDIAEAIELFGSDGYYIFFRILELMSREFDVHRPGFNDFNYDFLLKQLGKNRRSLPKVLKFFHERNRILSQKYVEGKQERIRLNCPKLKELSDEYTTKKLKSMSGVNRDNVGIESDTDYRQQITETESGLKDTGSGDPGFDYLDRVDEICQHVLTLPQKNGAGFNPYQFVGFAAKMKYHPRAIYEALSGLVGRWEKVKNPWAWSERTVIILSQNFYERVHMDQAKVFSDEWECVSKIPRIAELIDKIGG